MPNGLRSGPVMVEIKGSTEYTVEGTICEKDVFLPLIVVGVKVTDVVGLSLMRYRVTSVTPKDGMDVSSEIITRAGFPK